MEVSARLHVLLARESPRAIVIRRGPSKQMAVIGWDRTKDNFAVAQWLKGKLYPYRSDLSPDGLHWIYFAMSARNGQTWTAVAKAPYLKALDFYPKVDAWNGGGLFVSNTCYWLNETDRFPHGSPHHTSTLSLAPKWGDRTNEQGECPGIYFLRLARDGWTRTDTVQVGQNQHIIWFYKTVNRQWQLWKRFHIDSYHPAGRGPYYESYLLRNTTREIEHPMPDAEWADFDGNRLLWAERGKIMTGSVANDGLQNNRVLFDTNPLQFTELSAPY